AAYSDPAGRDGRTPAKAMDVDPTAQDPCITLDYRLRPLASRSRRRKASRSPSRKESPPILLAMSLVYGSQAISPTVSTATHPPDYAASGREGPARFAGCRIFLRTPIGMIRKAALWLASWPARGWRRIVLVRSRMRVEPRVAIASEEPGLEKNRR